MAKKKKNSVSLKVVVHIIWDTRVCIPETALLRNSHSLDLSSILGFCDHLQMT